MSLYLQGATPDPPPPPPCHTPSLPGLCPPSGELQLCHREEPKVPWHWAAATSSFSHPALAHRALHADLVPADAGRGRCQVLLMPHLATGQPPAGKSRSCHTSPGHGAGCSMHPLPRLAHSWARARSRCGSGEHSMWLKKKFHKTHYLSEVRSPGLSSTHLFVIATRKAQQRGCRQTPTMRRARAREALLRHTRSTPIGDQQRV